MVCTGLYTEALDQLECINFICSFIKERMKEMERDYWVNDPMIHLTL